MLKIYIKLVWVIFSCIAIVYLGYFLCQKNYYRKNVLPYIYWNQLIEKDPKPQNISLENYHLKNKQGFCWRDQKYYTKSELKQKAMLSFVQDVLLVEQNLYRTGKVLDANEREWGKYYTEKECKNNKVNCRLWLIPKAYTTKEAIAVIELIELNKLNINADNNILTESNKVEINSKDDISKIPFAFPDNKSILINVSFSGRAHLYPSDCCSIKTDQELLSDSKEKYLTTGVRRGHPYEGRIPPDVDTQSYGIGNFFLQVTQISHGIEYKEIYPFDIKRFTFFYFLNNCGDVLFKPFYWRYQS